jgi:hypothetical protein
MIAGIDELPAATSGGLGAGLIIGKSAKSRSLGNLAWYLDELFLKINGELKYLCRDVDQDGNVSKIAVAV